MLVKVLACSPPTPSCPPLQPEHLYILTTLLVHICERKTCRARKGVRMLVTQHSLLLLHYLDLEYLCIVPAALVTVGGAKLAILVRFT